MLMDVHWQRKNARSSGMSNRQINEWYDYAMANGALGGKLIGAGGGGFLMFMAPPERHDAVRAALGGLRETPFKFAAQGSAIIFDQE